VLLSFYGYDLFYGSSLNGFSSDFTFTRSGITVTWTQATRTLEFSDYAGLAFGAEGSEMFGTTSPAIGYVQSGDMWRWEDTACNIGDPAYPRLLPSELGVTGLITRTRLTELVADSHTETQATPAVGSVTSGSVWHRILVPQLTNALNWQIVHTDGSVLVRNDRVIYWQESGEAAVYLTEADNSGETLVYDFQIPAGKTVDTVTGNPNGDSAEAEITVRYNVPNLLDVMGDVDALETDAKRIVPAINELKAGSGGISEWVYGVLPAFYVGANLWPYLPLSTADIQGDGSLINGDDAVIRESGLYAISAVLADPPSAVTNLVFIAYVNGVETLSYHRATGTYYGAGVSGILALQEGDIVNFRANTTANITFNAGSTFALVKLV
jgi:hypothetical protein